MNSPTTMDLPLPSTDDASMPPARGAWRKAVRIVLRHYKRTLAPMFMLGILSIALEAGAYIFIITAAERFLSGEAVANLMPRIVLLGAGIVVTLLLLSAGVNYARGLYVARVRLVTFARSIDDALARTAADPFSPYVQSMGIKGMARVLRREARYLSRALTDVALLPQPLLVLLIILGLGAVFYPVFTAIAVFIIVLSAPFYLHVARWGSETIDDLLTSGQDKGQEDFKAVEAILETSDISLDGQSLQSSIKHSDDPAVQKFLQTYRQRVVLGPKSQLVTQVTAGILFACLGGYTFWAFTNDTLKLSDVLALVFGLKIGSQMLASVMQSGIIVSSYSPLISEFADFVYLNAADAPTEAPELKFEMQDLPRQAVWLGPPGMSRQFRASLSKTWGLQTHNLRFLRGESPRAFDQDEVREVYAFVKGPLAQLDTDLRLDMIATAKGKSVSSSALASDLVNAWSHIRNDPDAAFLWSARNFIELSPEDRDVILEWLGSRPLFIVYDAPPKRNPKPILGCRLYMDGDLIRELPQDVDYAAFRDSRAAPVAA